MSVVVGSALPADPRPRVVEDGSEYRLAGARCVDCGHALARVTPRCPRCAGPVEAASFGPGGVVWALTRVHIAARAEDPPPYVVAYVDLDDGPRLLARLTDPAAEIAVGAQVRLAALGPHGDPMVEVAA